MDRRLYDAARRGSIDDLLELLNEDCLILSEVSLTSAETPLHVAAKAGHLNFVKEIIRFKPEFAGELNEQGFSPLHIASANGNLEIVKELLKVNPDLCRLPGKHRKTAFHHAAIKGRVKIIKEMISNCVECVEDVTVRGETAVHLAVANMQFEAVLVMVERLKDVNKENVLNIKDALGNTVLHLAASTKQLEVVELLLGHTTISVNTVNGSNLTALDVLLQFPSEAGDREIEENLLRAGATRGECENNSLVAINIENGPNNTRATTRTISSSQSPVDPGLTVKDFKFYSGRDSLSEVRNIVLVIAILIATATFQAGLSPPGGLWQDTLKASEANATTFWQDILVASVANATASPPPHQAGSSILSTRLPISFILFVIFNSLGLQLSLMIIEMLTDAFPLKSELRVCLFAISFTYGTSLSSMSEGWKFVATVVIILAEGILITIQMKRIAKKRYI